MVMPCFDISCIDAQEDKNKAEISIRETLNMGYKLVSEGKLRKSRENNQDNLFWNETSHIQETQTGMNFRPKHGEFHSSIKKQNVFSYVCSSMKAVLKRQ